MPMQLALAVSGLENEHLNFALATRQWHGQHALRVRFSANRYCLAIRPGGLRIGANAAPALKKAAKRGHYQRA